MNRLIIFSLACLFLIACNKEENEVDFDKSEILLRLNVGSNISTYSYDRDQQESMVYTLKVFITDAADIDVCEPVYVDEVPAPTSDSIYNLTIAVPSAAITNGKRIYVVANALRTDNRKVGRLFDYGLYYSSYSYTIPHIIMSGSVDYDLSLNQTLPVIKLIKTMARLDMNFLYTNTLGNFISFESFISLNVVNVPGMVPLFNPATHRAEVVDNTPFTEVPYINTRQYNIPWSNDYYYYDTTNFRLSCYINENYMENESDYTPDKISNLVFAPTIKYSIDKDLESGSNIMDTLRFNPVYIPLKTKNSYKIKRNHVYSIKIYYKVNFDAKYIEVVPEDWIDVTPQEIEIKKTHSLSLSSTEVCFKVDPTKNPIEVDNEPKYISYSSDTVVSIRVNQDAASWLNVSYSATPGKSGIITVSRLNYQDLNSTSRVIPYLPDTITLRAGNVIEKIYVRQLSRVAPYDAYQDGNKEEVGQDLMDWGKASGWNSNNTLKGNTLPTSYSYGCAKYWINYSYYNNGAFSKWRLPSVSEMQNMVLNKNVIEWNGHAGNFNGLYWTADEVDKDNAYVVSTTDGTSTSSIKTSATTYKARCVMRDDAWNNISTYSSSK